MAQISDLIPPGCTVATYDLMSTVHDVNGDVVVIVCVSNAGQSARLARLIAGIPEILKAAEMALDRGTLLPLAAGMERLDYAVNPRPKLPAVAGG